MSFWCKDAEWLASLQTVLLLEWFLSAEHNFLASPHFPSHYRDREQVYHNKITQCREGFDEEEGLMS